MLRDMQAYKFCFTYNNPDVNHIHSVLSSFAPESLQIAFAQYELSSTGTRHLQGYFHLKKRMRVTELVKKMSNKMHYTIAKGSALDNWKYCHKEETRIVDLDRLYYPTKSVCESFVHLGVGVRGSKRSIQSCLDRLDSGEIPYDDPEYVRHYSTINTIRADINSDKIKRFKTNEEFVLRPWQQILLLLLNKQLDRVIYFVYETEGNVGKTWFRRHLVLHHNYMYVEGRTQNNDLGPLILKHWPAGIVYDIPRSSIADDGHLILSYHSLEALKDEMLFTTKYHGFSGFIPKMKLIVFSNAPPNISKLSRDRFKVFYIHNDSLIFDQFFE